MEITREYREFQNDALADMSVLVFGDEDGCLLTLGAYFDESLRQDGKEPICVGGYIFKPTAYKQFCRQWRQSVLRYKSRRFSAFHMTDLMRDEKSMKAWVYWSAARFLTTR